jgi:hypothetical protein
MSTPPPGQIRCPTCHRSTPPAVFCTQCGAPIPESARARPRGLDREELQERIRIHRPGDAAFRRGSPSGEGPEQAPSAYRPFQPEPEDDLILPAGGADETDAARVDNTPPGSDEAPPPPEPVALPPAPAVADGPAAREPQPAPWKPAPPPPIVEAAAAPPRWSAPDESYDDPGADRYDNRRRESEDDWGRRGSGIGPLAIGGFVLLGVLAIGVGAVISGVFSGGIALASPSPTPLVTASPSDTSEPSLEPTAGASVPVSAPANSSPTPFADGFSARTEPCAEEPASQDGCNSSGATVSGGSVWAWVGWRKGSGADVLGVTIVDASGASVGDGSLALSNLKCEDSCSGWGRFRFGGLGPGNYRIRLDRNGLPVAEASFTVTT